MLYNHIEEKMIINDKKYPEFNEQKATEAASLLLSMHGGKMSRLKIIKLLYIADRKALENWERPITFDTYYSMKEGQVLSGVLDLINDKIKDPLWRKHIEQSDDVSIRLHGKPVKFQKLSRAEVILLEDVYKEFGHWNRFDLGDFTKKFPEYKPTTTRERTYIEEILSYIYGEEDAERIRQTLEEEAYLELALEG